MRLFSVLFILHCITAFSTLFIQRDNNHLNEQTIEVFLIIEKLRLYTTDFTNLQIHKSIPGSM